MQETTNFGYYMFLLGLFILIVFSEVRSGKKYSKVAKEFGLAFAIIFVIRSFVVDIFQIPSGSMVNNLLVGDFPIVKKYSYGYTPFSLWLSEFIYPNLKSDMRFFSSEPQRGDIFVFRLPKDPSINYVKRVVGLPGDKIQMIDGVLYVNDQKVELQKVGNYEYDNDREPGDDRYLLCDMDVFKEQLPSEKKPHNIIMINDDFLNQFSWKSAVREKRTTPVYYVPKDHYLGLGDNRDFSKDSRVMDEVGFIHRRYIIGKVWCVLMSIGHHVRIYEPWRWLQNFRWSRFFKVIE